MLLNYKKFLNVLGGSVIAVSLMFGNYAFAGTDINLGTDVKIEKEKKKKSGKKGKRTDKANISVAN